MEKKQMKLIGLIASLIATVAIWTGFSIGGTIGDVLAVIWMIGLVVGYVLGGGLKGAIGFALKLGKFGWLIIPFPFDIMTGMLSIGLAFLLFLFCPAIFVFLSFIKSHEVA